MKCKQVKFFNFIKSDVCPFLFETLFIFFTDDNQTYDGYIAFLSCHTTSMLSLLKAQRPTIFITYFPCGPRFMDKSNCNTEHSFFPSCDDIVHMLNDVIYMTNWTKTTIVRNDISGMEKEDINSRIIYNKKVFSFRAMIDLYDIVTK